MYSNAHVWQKSGWAKTRTARPLATAMLSLAQYIEIFAVECGAGNCELFYLSNLTNHAD